MKLELDERSIDFLFIRTSQVAEGGHHFSSHYAPPINLSTPVCGFGLGTTTLGVWVHDLIYNYTFPPESPHDGLTSLAFVATRTFRGTPEQTCLRGPTIPDGPIATMIRSHESYIILLSAVPPYVSAQSEDLRWSFEDLDVFSESNLCGFEAGGTNLEATALLGTPGTAGYLRQMATLLCEPGLLPACLHEARVTLVRGVHEARVTLVRGVHEARVTLVRGVHAVPVIVPADILMP
ncbi:hypothetical protein CYMTET_34192 [Cymbomonas tetramitiformis]|uniref:Uncharacterized protein n=1 Tax=Cymbomonas tetramitiformis TaxID=36881 RepID=A0AAE0FBP8_9CHLO|nr:hypothetical protein CYMTET_34192 [Cymbomonas tetramitiformis]